jgi:phospholipase C
MNHRAIFAGFAAAFVLATPAVLAQDHRGGDSDDRAFTRTPIKHLVVIFQENVSFDHYFGTYPVAQNKPGETQFQASRRTPTSINTLLTPLDPTHHFSPLTGVDLINNNPNANPAAPGNGRPTAPPPPIRSGCRPRRP